MKLSKQTSDAIQILCYCYRQGDNLSKVKDIAQNLGLTKQMTFKLTKILGQADFIKTVRGPNGGIIISEFTKTATLGSIVRALEIKPTVKQAEQDNTFLNFYVDEAFEAFLEVLDQHLLADMATQGKTEINRKIKKKPKCKTMPAAIHSLRLHQNTTPG